MVECQKQQTRNKPSAIRDVVPETGETRQSHLLFLVIWANIQGTQHEVDDGYQQYCQRINSTQPGTNR